MASFNLISVLSIVHLISLCISAIAVVILYRAYRVSKNTTVKYFMWFFVCVFAWMAAYFITLQATTGTFSATKGWILSTSHGFFLIGLAFIARIIATFRFPKYEKIIFWTTLALAVGITIFGLISRGIAADPQSINSANSLIVQVSAVFTVLVLFPSFILFFYRVLHLRMRLLLFAPF